MKLKIILTMPYYVTRNRYVSGWSLFRGGSYKDVVGKDTNIEGHLMLEKEYPDNYLQEEAIMMLDKIEIPCTNNCNGIAFGSIHVETSSRTAIFTCSHSCHEPWPDQKKLFLRDGWKITNDPT